jgi:hypothetical protein
VHHCLGGWEKLSGSQRGYVTALSMSRIEMSGSAYCIEATALMNQVTAFLLQRNVNISNIKHIEKWLVMFKEVDLRLRK